ncbi:MAG: hopanoid biosynthesis associated radical SAM protein HpnJ [Acidobacteria bacterium]|nr:hopanoid biosynthesis associated radical SAM protein HpnJ [Acidobacteriota bacterium]
MKTLLLNPPSFEGFDGGASSRWPATREITSFWYPVWLCYPAGLIPESKVVDAPPHGVTVEQAVDMTRDYEFVVMFTSSAGFSSDIRLAGMMKDVNPAVKIAFVGPHVTALPEESLRASSAIDFIARKEFDYSVAEFAQGKPLEEIDGISYRRNGSIVHNPERPAIQDLDSLPFVTDIYKRDLDIHKYNVPFLLHPFVAFYTERGCPALCTFCLWPQTLSGHPWRIRSADNVAAEVRRTLEHFPDLKEIFFDDDTFNIRKSRVVELCAKLKPLNFTWSCTSRVTVDYETLKAMKEAGCRLLIVGYESGDPQILKNIKKGATVEQAITFTKNCKKLGLLIHGDFIMGLPGETPETVRCTIDFAKRLDVETIQVSIAHPLPGTEFYDWARANHLVTTDTLTDSQGHQLANISYPGLSSVDILEAVEQFYGEYYFRPKVVWRVVRKAIFNGQERKRLYREAREYLSLRSKRKKIVADHRAEERGLPPSGLSVPKELPREEVAQ